MKSYLLSAIALGTFLLPALAQDKPDLTDQKQRVSYAMGMDVVRVLKIDDFDIDMNTIVAGMTDMQAGKPALTPTEKKLALKQMQDAILAKAVAKKEAAGEVHRKEGTAFLAANAKKDGIQFKEVMAPDGTNAVLQYKILKSGSSGASPGSNDVVVVRYHGTLIDGTVFDIFDDSVKRGDTAIFKMADVIPGWAAALQMMKPGDKWQLFVPPSLAYADYGPPEIGMYTTLIYELELVKAVPAEQASTVLPPNPETAAIK
jgi:FKBP-type peptidyl-prolyl cis-trans isomerase